MFDDTKGFIFCNGVDIPKVVAGRVMFLGDFWYVDNRIHKFSMDELMMETDHQFFFLDGYIENKSFFYRKYKTNNWKEAGVNELKQGDVNDLRGAFCGFIVGDDTSRLFVDHVGNRTLYYYNKNNITIISNRFYYITELLQYYDKEIKADEQAIRYMLTQGFMMDDTTFCADIKRVCPGTYVDLTSDGRIIRTDYFCIDNTDIQNKISINDAVEGIDYFFRQAVEREFIKDKEYKYEHLVDLSGGLDSRMVAWVAHEMGYTDQTNITYCKKGYRDFVIAQEIALDLSHFFIFIPLDDFRWYMDIEENTKLTNGASFYSASTGANRVLKTIKGGNYGIEHTGMLGDVVLGSYFRNTVQAYKEPSGNDLSFSKLLDYSVPNSVIEQHKNNELFWLYTRGFLGMQVSYMLRQEYFETSSPFLDVDFLSYVMSLPHEMRACHKVYLKWIEAKYSRASRYGWENWYGLRPIEKNRNINKKIYEAKNRIERCCSKIIKGTYDVGMNPVDYWLMTNDKVRNVIKDYYEKEFPLNIVSSSLGDDMKKMYNLGSAQEKSMVLTVIAAIKLMLNNKLN